MLKIFTSLVLVTLLANSAIAVVFKDNKRNDGFDTYGPPPRPAPQYGPPQQNQPHREYGVPQKIPFRDYGPPALKYGPPKFILNGGGGVFANNNFGGGLQEQIKSHFGVPRPHYGPPHIQQKPSASYGPPQPQSQYGPPLQRPPPHRPAPNYGPPPRPNYGPPQALPSPHPAPFFKPHHQPASSYGPPPSGPINLPPKPVYGPPPQQNYGPPPQQNYGPPPQQNYGPPPLPAEIPGQRPPNFHRVPETTIILTNGGGNGGHQGGHQGGQHGGPIKQVQIEIDAAGHTHSISGSQAPFHTACDGWKPIPAPPGAYVEHNQIDTQSGYSQVSQGFGTQYNGGGATTSTIIAGPSQAFGTQYNGGGATTSTIITGPSQGGSIIDDLTDEQLVAIALQSDGGNNQISPPNPEPLPQHQHNGPAEHHGVNSIETDAIQLALGAIDETYNRPPPDSYAPGSVHAQKYNTIGGIGLAPPQGNYLPPPPAPPLPSPDDLVSAHHQQHQAAQAGLGIQYGTQSGNTLPFPSHNGPPPHRPVSFRPPVPQGLLESIGAAVQHLDQFGVKPPAQPEQTYIPPATNEIGATGPSNPSLEYGVPPQPPAAIIQQQLPQPQPLQGFIQHQQQHIVNVANQYRPPLPPQQQYLPPGRPLPPPPTQYLPPLQSGGTSFHQSNANFENSFSASQHNQQFVHTQGLPIQEPRFNQVVHECGHGPNLVGASYQLQNQQQQQQQQYQEQQQLQQYTSASSGNAYNAITQSIPIAERHTQFIAGPQDSYAPPASGSDIDHEGYASQQSSVATLPDGSDPQSLPGLDGLNVISAQKSQSIHITPQELDAQKQRAASSHTNYQLQIGSNGKQVHAENGANHEEILSQGLLQTILSAIEHPQSKPDQQDQQTNAPNHRYGTTAQSRSDIDLEDDATPELDENEEEPTLAESSNVESRVSINGDDDEEEVAIVREIKPIVAAELEYEQDAKH